MGLRDFLSSIFFSENQRHRRSERQHADRMEVQHAGLELQRRRVEAQERRIELQCEIQHERSDALAKRQDALAKQQDAFAKQQKGLAQVEARKIGVMQEALKVKQRVAQIEAEKLLVEKRRLSLQEKMRSDEIIRFEKQRQDRFELAYEEFSRRVSFDSWPVNVEPRDLRSPAFSGERPPVTIFFRNHGAFNDETFQRVEDEVRRKAMNCFSRHDHYRPVRFYWSNSWRVNAIDAADTAEKLAKHSFDNPTAILELRRDAHQIHLESAVWGLEPIVASSTDPLKVGSPILATISSLPIEVLERMKNDPAEFSRFTTGVATTIVCLVDACALRRFAQSPLGPTLIPKLVPNDLAADERIEIIEYLRQQYNLMVNTDPELCDEYKLYIGFAFSRSGEKAAALAQAYQLLEEWCSDAVSLLASDNDDSNRQQITFRGTDSAIAGLSDLFELLELEREADLIRTHYPSDRYDLLKGSTERRFIRLHGSDNKA